MIRTKLNEDWMCRAVFCLLAVFMAFLMALKGTAIHNIAASLLVICLFILGLRFKRQVLYLPNKYFFLPYLLFAVGLILSAFLQGEPQNMKATLHFLRMTIPFWLVFLAAKCIRLGQPMSNAFLLAGIISTVVGVKAYMDAAHWVDGRFFIETNPNVTSHLLALPLPFLLLSVYNLRKSKILCILAATVSLALLAMLGMTHSRGGIIAFLAGGLLVAGYYAMIRWTRWSLKRTLVAGTILAIVFSFVLSVLTLQHFARHYDYERVYLAQSAFAMWKNHPLTGIGYTNWDREYAPHYMLPDAKEPTLPHAHNDFLIFLSTTGTLGAVGYLAISFGILFYLLQNLYHCPREGLLWAMLWTYMALHIHGLFDVGLQYSQAARIYFALLGLTLAVVENNVKHGCIVR